jgi:hypothetical protein
VFTISTGKGHDPSISCAVLSRVMPRGHYTFRKKRPTGLIFVYQERVASKTARQVDAGSVARTTHEVVGR